MIRLVLVLNGLASEPMLTGPKIAYFVMIELLGIIFGSYVLTRYFNHKGIEHPWKIVSNAVSIAMITSFILGQLVWGWMMSSLIIENYMVGMSSEPMITGPSLAYMILIEVFGIILGTCILMIYFRKKEIAISWEILTIAMSIAMITSWVLGLLAWGWIL